MLIWSHICVILLKGIVENSSGFYFLNGLNYKNVYCDSKFSFYRGVHKSQNDIGISNSLENINYLL